MTDNTKKSNNLFDFATSELSQDAFFCWSLNWLSVKEDTEDPYYKYGKAMLDLFLGEHKKDIYKEVKVKKQFNKIDVLVLFKDNQDNQYALIIEDKTNTSEHNEQIKKYREKLNEALSKNQDIGYGNLPGNQIYTAYVKTGIMYSQDLFMKNTVNTVVDFDRLYGLLEEYCKEQKGMISSDIFLDYYHYLKEINDKNCRIEEMIDEYNYVEALKTEYGRYCFLKKIFYEENGKMDLNCKDKTDEADMYVETIKSGNNNGKVPYAEYTIWNAKHNDKMAKTDQDEYHSIFWRIDSPNSKADEEIDEPYISLRHYDEYTKVNENTRKRKKDNYTPLREHADKYPNRTCFKQIGKRYNYIESDLIFIPMSNLQNKDFKEIKKLVRDITEYFISYCKENQSIFR
ncbi:PD-(D/E)XK nuclease family protein [Solobacterium moorei]|uniref:PD-(D/E)XK nuclease family protein n=1 Tax=Solobacterium moorei TaxID=102148 RepID=UPI0023F448E1|nr:PD-(D/E)XK nuclease family protein [Solobacterium moorei]